MDEIKLWQTRERMKQLAMLLMAEGVSYAYTFEAGIAFRAPDFYIEDISRRLVTQYGCNEAPAFTRVEG